GIKIQITRGLRKQKTMFLVVSDHFFQTEPMPPTALLHNDPLHHQYQLAPVDLSVHPTALGQRKGAALQSFVIQHKPTMLPVQKLHVRAPAVQEHEQITASGAPAQTRGHQPAETVKTFPHIAMAAVQVITVRRTQTEHQARAISLDSNPRSADGTSSRTPLG